MSHRRHLVFFLVFLGTMCAADAAAQSDNGVSLGDLARSLRQSKQQPKEPAAPAIIDNDNLSQVIEQVEHFRLGGKPMLSFDSAGRNFQVTSPDGTCSLSFNANNTALLATPFVSQDLPPSELAKLDGPANIRGDTLEVSIHNATTWSLREITVGLTIVRPDPTATYYGIAKLVPTVAENEVPSEKRSDMTVLLHLKGSAAPFETAVFREKLYTNLSADQEWHWAIVQAKGIPAAPDPGGSKEQSIPTTAPSL
jgi:hypothetical protein